MSSKQVGLKIFCGSERTRRTAFLLQPGTVQTGLTRSNREPESEQFKWDFLIWPPWETVSVAGQSQILWV